MAISKTALLQRMSADLIRQATYFLEESGAFYPFALSADVNQQIRNVSFFTKDEFPEADVVMNELEAAVLAGLRTGQYKSALIGVDVSVTAPIKESSEKKSALQVRIYDENGNVTIRHSLYTKTEDGYQFTDLIDL